MSRSRGLHCHHKQTVNDYVKTGICLQGSTEKDKVVQ
jgi:hypothetical protein